MVFQDGLQYNAPVVFDNLIHKKSIPPLVGVFVMHGRVRAPSAEALDRMNRSFEYDSVSEDYARFLVDELLPHVAAAHGLSLSTDPNDRAIAGNSSGAIAAFTAAWQRPDAFRRVFSAIGTYVGLRGGDQYPVLVRKTEPKPIRVYLQGNKNDTWNPLFGNWFTANTAMEAALNFAGYEVTHMWQEGGHETKQATAIFADAMRWLWKGWPEPVKGGWSANNMLTSILDAKEQWQLVEQKMDTAALVANNPATLPDGSQYILKGGAITFKAKKKGRAVDKDSNLGYALAVSPDQGPLVVSGKHAGWLYN